MIFWKHSAPHLIFIYSIHIHSITCEANGSVCTSLFSTTLYESSFSQAGACSSLCSQLKVCSLTVAGIIGTKLRAVGKQGDFNVGLCNCIQLVQGVAYMLSYAAVGDIQTFKNSIEQHANERIFYNVVCSCAPI